MSEAPTFDPTVERALGRAADEAARRRHRQVELEHVLWALLVEPEVRTLLERCGADPDEVQRDLEDYLDLVERTPSPRRPAVARSCQQVLHMALVVAAHAGRPASAAQVLNWLLSVEEPPYAASVLRAAGVDRAELRSVASHGQLDLRAEVPAGATQVSLRMHNDDFTTMEFVVEVLTNVLHLPLARARDKMMEIHQGGSAVVATLAVDDAVEAVQEIRGAAEEQGFPLRVSLEAV